MTAWFISSLTGMPASAAFKIGMIIASLNRLLFMSFVGFTLRSPSETLIELWLWSKRPETKLDYVHPYYQGDGAQRLKLKFRSIKRIRLSNGDEIVPDLNVRLEIADGQKRLFTFEYHRGKDVGKILRQLEQHAQALRDGVLSERYKHPYSHFVLSVYETPQCHRKCYSAPESTATI